MATRGKYKPDSRRLEGEKDDYPLSPGIKSDDRALLSRKILAGLVQAECTFPHSGLMVEAFPFSPAIGLMHHVLT